MLFSKLMAKMFNRRASSPESKPQEIIDRLDLQSGFHVADVGSGGGYFTMEFSKRVGEAGKVYAVDTNRDFLAYIQKQVEQDGVRNVITVLTDEHQALLPEIRLDVVFLRSVFHHLPDQVIYFSNLRNYLSPNGRVAIIDYRKKDGLNFTNLFGHYTPEEAIKEKMKEAGYDLIESYEFLPEQSFNIFGVDGTNRG